MKRANERTFQGQLLSTISKIIEEDKSILFYRITQEENVGEKKHSKFADLLLYSSKDSNKVVSFELKPTSWDATDEILVNDAMEKAFRNGFEYFVTGTPRQLAIFKTFKENTTPYDRKLKVHTISNVKKDDDILTLNYEKEVYPKLKVFLHELSDLIHEIKEIHWDSIDRYFVNKLSAYILEASAEMLKPMYDKIHNNKAFRIELKNYLSHQDIFNLNLSFEAEDVYKICQLANYLLYLKILFYNYLLRDLKELHLEPLQIPNDIKRLNSALKNKFESVLEHDYELIFTSSVLDDFIFDDKYLNSFKRNVEVLNKLEFHDIDADIIGTIYNTLIDNQEQHDRGQHFTNTNEVDIVNSFCINSNTNLLLDSGCGAATFLVRGYYFIKKYHPELIHEQLLERLWGIEIADFPAFLATLNLSLLNIKSFNNYPVIIRSDFAKITTKYSYHGYFLNESKKFKIKNISDKQSEVEIPMFDTCVGNPPYIRQEKIENKDEWNRLVSVEHGIEKINQQSDFYVYYLMHTAAFLKNGGRLGYVISSSWLDVNFGTGFQKFLLDNFKIIAIIDNQKQRSFETASINTVILILEKCNNQKSRKENLVRFVRMFSDYSLIIGNSNDLHRFNNVKAFTDFIEKIETDTVDENYYITIINQEDLESVSTIKSSYNNGNWGAKYLRSPLIFNRLLVKAGKRLIPIYKVSEIKRGITSGANEFFYLIDDTEKAKSFSDHDSMLQFGINEAHSKIFWDQYGWFYSGLNKRHYVLEKEFLKPLFKTQKEALNLDVSLNKMKFAVLMCDKTKDWLKKNKKRVLEYINDAEKDHEIHKRSSCESRRIWYDLSYTAFDSDFIFPSKIGEKYRIIDNRTFSVSIDKVNYGVKVNETYQDIKDIIFLILNSTVTRFFIDLFARQLTGKQTFSDVDVNVFERSLIINPSLLKEVWPQLKDIYKSLKNREQGTIYQETKNLDKIKLDRIIIHALGASDDDLEDLYFNACKYIKDREIKSASVGSSKNKKRITYDDAIKLIENRFSDIPTYKELIDKVETIIIEIPDMEAVFPKNSEMQNLFGVYSVQFKEGNKVKELIFKSSEQLMLIEFLFNALDIRGRKIKIPEKPKDSVKLLKTLKEEYTQNIDQIKNLLKLHRVKANHVSIFRDLILKK